MRLIMVRIEPSVPDLTVEGLTAVLDGAGVEVQHVYADVAGSTSRIALYVRVQESEIGQTADAVTEALAPIAGADRLVRARTHSWAESPWESPW